MGLLSEKLLNTWLTSKNAVQIRISFAKDDGKFLLKSNAYHIKLNTMQLLQKVDSLCEISDYVYESGDNCVIDPCCFNKVRDCLQKYIVLSIEQKYNVNINMPNNISKIRVIDIPENFRIIYTWDEEANRLNKNIDGDFKQSGPYIYSRGHEIWEINLNNCSYNKILEKHFIEKDDIPEFINNVIPEAHRLYGAKNPLVCDVELSDVPAFIMDGHREESNGEYVYFISFHDNTNSGLISNTPEIENEGFIAHNGTLYPYAKIKGYLCNEFPLRMTEEDFVNFAIENNGLNRYFSNDLQELIKNLSFIPRDKLSLTLVCTTSHHNGIGKNIAVPAVVAGETRYKAKETSILTNGSPRFIKLNGNYVRVKDLRAIGIGQNGNLTNGIPLSERAVSNADIITGTYISEDEPWFELKTDAKEFWIAEGPPEKIAASHFKFLLNYGMSGAVITNVDTIRITEDFMEESHKDFPSRKILFLFKKEGMQEIKKYIAKNSEWINEITAYTKPDKSPDSPKKNISVMSYSRAEKYFTHFFEKWDILYLHNFDDAFKSVGSKLFNTVNNINASVKLGISKTPYYSLNRGQMEAAAELFEINENIHSYILRRIHVPIKLPVKSSVETFKIRTLDELKEDWNYADERNLPMRMEFIKDNASNTFSYNYNYNIDKFIYSAKMLNTQTAEKAQYVPYYNYTPSVNSMNKAQKKWYAYFREQAAEGNFLKTDESYLFVLAYEIINHTVCSSVDERYNLFVNLFHNYANFEYGVAKYFNRWINDFAMIYLTGKIKPENLSQVIGVNFLKENVELEKKLMENELNLNCEQLQAICSYKFCNSKFYLSQDKNEIDACYLKVIYETDRYMREKYKAGILESYLPFRDDAHHIKCFEGAPVTGGVNIEFFCVPFSSHNPLKDFITSIIKYTENTIRKIKGAPGKLKCETPDDGIINVINSVLSREIGSGIYNTGSLQATGKREIEIDISSLGKHRNEAETLTRMLAVEDSFVGENEAVTDSPNENTVERNNFPAPEKRGGNGNIISVFIQSLNETQLKTLAGLTDKNNVKDNLSAIEKEYIIMPELVIDEINEIFMDTTGDLLIDGFEISDEYNEEIKNILTKYKG